MRIGNLKRTMKTTAAGVALGLGLMTAPLHAAPVVTGVNADLSASPFTFSYLGSSFTVDGRGGFPNFLSISTTGNAAVRTVFGNPSSDFTNRGTVVYDQNTLGGFASFASPTTIPFTNGENFIGLRVTSGGENFFGYLFTTNSTLNSFGFETVANTAIRPTTDIPAAAAVPEPATWAMMIGGFGMIGGALRVRTRKLAYA